MIQNTLMSMDELPGGLLSNLENRDIAVWTRSLPQDADAQGRWVRFLGLPWRLVVAEMYTAGVIEALESSQSLHDPLTRKRGFIQVIDTDPSRIELPQRSLPIYLLSGRLSGPKSDDFASRLRRLTMVEEVRRSGVREILVLLDHDGAIPTELADLWSSGFRSRLTFVSDSIHAAAAIREWLERAADTISANFVHRSTTEVVNDLLDRYAATYPEDRRIVRVRDRAGSIHQVDITAADDPERPILEWYSLLEERDLKPLLPDELSEQDFVAFFQNPVTSWRPYAAGLPWLRDQDTHAKASLLLKKLDAIGPEENCIAYIASESGAGGTTLVRTLAWKFASQGYPVLVAKSLPFAPDALPVANFLKRAAVEIENEAQHTTDRTPVAGESPTSPHGTEHMMRYEVPWLVIFDTLHWQYRDSELVQFRNELAKSGRPVCMVTVTGTVLGISFYNPAVFTRIADLNHSIRQDQARELGRHLNRYLQVYGKQRTDSQWARFYAEHSVRYLDGMAAFWVTLSFWIQGQYDLNESIQQWMYRCFKENARDKTMQVGVLEIAALSSERLPIPEALLPQSSGPWPLSQLLEDIRSTLAPLGLVRISANGEKHWALVHDILGRFLINALFYDFALREELGFGEAKDAEHLRFMVLRQISRKSELGERRYRSIGEDFATSIFKIDPDHGRASFAFLWRDVLGALDTMPRALRDRSRLFRHHTAVSRRRVSTLDEKFYGVTINDRVALLSQAIDDLNYALTYIEYAPGSESNLNLFNSLANAYFDLARVELTQGASAERIRELRELASEATRRAYQENPTSSFAIETYVRNLLQSVEVSSVNAVDHCVEALGILFSALASNEAVYRRSQLGALADQAMELLFAQAPVEVVDTEPLSAVDVLVRAWFALSAGGWSAVPLKELPESIVDKALGSLAHQAGRGNMQVLRLTLDLTCLSAPTDFKRQLALLEELDATDYRQTPQLRLEYAILLFQNARAAEGDKIFRTLRELWRESEHFVQVPERLHWLRSMDGSGLQTVQAIAGSDFGDRAKARVREFGNALVPFRPEEFGFRVLMPGTRFTAHVSFGHNGPFLRPVTARPVAAQPRTNV